MKWLVMLPGLDILILLVFVAPEFLRDASLSTVAIMRGLVTALLPVVVLLLTGMLSHETKAKLVYWKVTNPTLAARRLLDMGLRMFALIWLP